MNNGKQLNILFDVDGVLANFRLAFTRLMVELGHMEQPEADSDAETWEIPVADAKVFEGFGVLAGRPYWWVDYVHPLVGPDVFKRINELNYTHHIVFATDRRGTPHPQTQTVLWLRERGIHHPNVIVTKRKGDVAKVMDADFSIEDKVENANCIHWISDVRPTKSYLLDKKYNREGRAKNLIVVRSVDEFLNDVEGIER